MVNGEGNKMNHHHHHHHLTTNFACGTTQTFIVMCPRDIVLIVCYGGIIIDGGIANGG
jgi:hypothetical protein